MASNLRVDQILPSTSTNVAIGTATGTVTLAGTTSGTFSGNLTGSVNSTGVTTVTTLRATSIVGVTTAGISTVYVTSINEGQLQGYRNMLYNGAMVVNQRGFTSAASTSTGYSVDRWMWSPSNDSVVAVGQSTSAAAQPTGQGFTNSLHVRVTTADSSLSAAQYAVIEQKLEGYDLQRIKKGSSNAEPVTLSFWVRSSKIGTYIAELIDNDNTRQVSKSYSINAADTWEKKIITFPADTTGAFDNDNNGSMQVIWWLAAGSNYTSGTLNTSWAASTNANRAIGQVNFLDTAGAQFNLTGCQLEVGPNATEFEFRSYGDELRMCQRYYYRDTYTVASNVEHFLFYGSMYGTTQLEGVYSFPVEMRSAPSLGNSALSTFRLRNGGEAITALNIYGTNTRSGLIYTGNTATGTQKDANALTSITTNGTVTYLEFIAELL